MHRYGPRHCTEDVLVDAVEWLTRRVDEGHVASVTSVDLSRAFDSVNHDILLTKLTWYGIDERWFRSYLDSRRQAVRGGSLIIPLSHGVGTPRIPGRPNPVQHLHQRPPFPPPTRTASLLCR